MVALVLVFSTLLGGLGQVLFKMGLDAEEPYLIALIAAGLAVYAVSTVAYFYALSRKSLSWAYGFGGLSYIFASILALLLLGEAITPVRWVGIGIIAIGTAIIGVS
jgi:EamA-like transporter family.